MKFRALILGVAVCVIAMGTLSGVMAHEPQSDDQPTVMEAVPAIYPAIAMAAQATGSVIVEVKINEKGEVTSANATNGHKLLQGVAVLAAKRWLFSPSDGKDKFRFARLTFSFILVPKYSSSADLLPVFLPPYKVEIRDSPSRLVQTINADPPIKRK